MLKVVQCWDDGVNDDIRLIGILRKHGAKASFNLNPATHGELRQGAYNERWGKRIERLARHELNDVYAGFTIANHSMTHPWPTQIPLADWRTEVVDARKILQDWFQQEILGFVYPYGDCDAATADVVREAGHLYARTTKNATPCMPVADPMMLHADCHFHNERFWDLYEQAKTSEAGVFYFWGHSYELCTEAEWDAFDAKIARISADGDAEWAELPDLF
ncbi:polysaccharide deacetylase family protein [Coraliomargarita sp. SDUM461004]|uniref:Polysaccharide deacetylase family protein n=1 Tax=Thalassobacterium sedimentorum TaxID=3041258 RepID=A0ABU1AIL7_9BACT|nr:polysaccharide deacetylase family protein [Coraliomargarita sp. SDUM461004]MDQ8194626.1 polysaccharide deacetylase family protein [Coraliomargarita sp. SDUM461004]